MSASSASPTVACQPFTDVEPQRHPTYYFARGTHIFRVSVSFQAEVAQTLIINHDTRLKTYCIGCMTTYSRPTLAFFAIFLQFVTRLPILTSTREKGNTTKTLLFWKVSMQKCLTCFLTTSMLSE